MRKLVQLKNRGLLLLSGAGAIVLAFLGLSLAVTATGSARFAVALGYDAEVGYVVGAVFDIAKALLPVVLVGLLAWRTSFLFAILGVAWTGLATYSALATHATISLAVANLEREGAWKMESRSNVQAELAEVEQRMLALSQPLPPRPSGTVREALNGERVPASVWRDSQECQAIRGSQYFQTACSKVLQLRGELAAAEDYERLDARARELRQRLAAAPIVAVKDPLPEAFASTLGRLLLFDGRAGVALLLTLVVEIMSCFGFAALRALREGQRSDLISQGLEQPQPDIGEGEPSGMNGRSVGAEVQSLPSAPDLIAPEGSEAQSAPDSAQVRAAAGAGGGKSKESEPPSTVLPPPSAGISEGMSPIPPRVIPPSSGRVLSLVGSHVPDFAMDCLQPAAGRSLPAADLWFAYICWCTARGHHPASQQRLGLELAGLGFTKWKSSGRIRYRDVQLAA
jgi:hypothetical protein